MCVYLLNDHFWLCHGFVFIYYILYIYIYKIPGRKRKQWKKCVLDIISDMDLTSTSLGSKEAVSSINNAFKNFVISSLQFAFAICILECVRRVN